MERCSCPFHRNEAIPWKNVLTVEAPFADVTCPLCGKPFCRRCFDSCGHQCDWGGGVAEAPVCDAQPAGV
jgi:hypothetical protein